MKCYTLPAKIYQAGFRNNLILTGFESGFPEWLGNKTDFQNYYTELREMYCD